MNELESAPQQAARRRPAKKKAPAPRPAERSGTEAFVEPADASARSRVAAEALADLGEAPEPNAQEDARRDAPAATVQAAPPVDRATVAQNLFQLARVAVLGGALALSKKRNARTGDAIQLEQACNMVVEKVVERFAPPALGGSLATVLGILAAMLGDALRTAHQDFTPNPTRAEQQPAATTTVQG